jgi:uncharacterized membrane protein YkoI
MRCKRLLSVSLLLLAATLSGVADGLPVPLSQTPPAVEKTIAAQIGSGKLGEIDRSEEREGTTFDVDFTTSAGEAREFCVAADGTLLSTGVTLAETPAAVQKTIQTEAAGSALESIDRNIEESGDTYDVDTTKNGRTQSFTVDDDGTLLSLGVTLEETPAAVQKAVQAQAAGGPVRSIDKNVDDTEITYDVETASAGVAKDFTLDEDGAMVSAEVALAGTPPPVQAAIAKQTAGGTVKSIDANFDPDGTTYDVEAVMKDGAMNSFTVGAGGELRSVEVSLAQVPPAPRKTIQDQIGTGKIIWIDRSLVPRKGKFPYEVEGCKGGKPFDFSVGPKGKFLGLDE